MRSAVYCVDVISKRVDLLVVTVVVLDGHLDRKRVCFLFKVDRFVVKGCLVLIQVFYELRDTALVVKLVRPLWLFAFILYGDPDALVQEGLLAKTFG